MSRPKTKICFVNPDTYPVLSGTAGKEYIGGESVQHTLLAKAFLDAGFEVSVVVRDFGQPQGEMIDGITVWKTFRQEAGLPVLRFVHPRMTSALRALKLADADIYYQSCASSLTGITAAFCKRHRRQFVFRVAHDSDLEPGNELIPFWRDKKLYQYGLRAADLISVQSEFQAGLLRENYDRDGALINMVVEPPAEIRARKDIDVLWVNNLREFKRPELLLDLARTSPDLRFTMIGGPCRGEEALYEKIVGGAAEIPNLDMVGAVPYSQVNQYFERARLFVNTSESEGFPNSFLQAWIRGLPVISFFDPDEVIQRFGLGAAVPSLAAMSEQIADLAGNQELLEETGSRAETYIRERYSPGPVVDAYVAALDGLPGC